MSRLDRSSYSGTVGGEGQQLIFRNVIRISNLIGRNILLARAVGLVGWGQPVNNWSCSLAPDRAIVTPTTGHWEAVKRDDVVTTRDYPGGHFALL